jgi:hypothetical protein
MLVPQKRRDPDSKGAVDADVQKIVLVDGSEVLGYSGDAKEEHTGESLNAERFTKLPLLTRNA